MNQGITRQSGDLRGSRVVLESQIGWPRERRRQARKPGWTQTNRADLRSLTASLCERPWHVSTSFDRLRLIDT